MAFLIGYIRSSEEAEMVMLASPKIFSRIQPRKLREPPPRQQQPFVSGFHLFSYYHLSPCPPLRV
jgi:hypothetical protein